MSSFLSTHNIGFYEGEAILISTHQTGLYEEMGKKYLSFIVKYAPYLSSEIG